ncbi:MAG: T9SS type A sorting domain-containing protein [Prevotellaceae bacterium]|jgi:hypothetical protein|nr:T9SS type A sorting domain-containing protein [Prevotellaceae bacterium]
MKKIFLILIFAAVGVCAGNVFAGVGGSYNPDGQQPEKEALAVPKIFVSANILHIQNVDDGVKVEIYSIVGSKVKTATLSNGTVDITDLNKGIYIVRVGKVSQKIVIQ